MIVGLGSQLSVAVALPVALGSVEALQSTVVSAGQVMLGAVVSTTLMVCAQLAVLPQVSVAVQVRVMTIAFGQLPGTELSLYPAVRSRLVEEVAVARPVTVGFVEELHSTVTVGGQWMVGGVLLPTMILCTL